jgi:hypothetical protein
MALGLQLDWTLCPDGVVAEWREPGPAKTFAEQGFAGVVLKPRTARRTSRRFWTVFPENAVALGFINARSDDDLIAWCNEYGLPGWPLGSDGASEMPLEEVRARQENLERMLALSPTELGARRFKGPELRLGLATERGSLMLALRPETLDAYMQAEGAMILAGGATIVACKHCGTLFTGRSDKAYCSNKCRTATHRQKSR